MSVKYHKITLYSCSDITFFIFIAAMDKNVNNPKAQTSKEDEFYR